MTTADLFFTPLISRIIGLLPALIMMWYTQRKPGTSGGGDIKLMGALGFAAGITNLFFVLLSATVFGFIWSKRMKEQFIPLAAFLAPGAWIWIIWYYVIT